MIDSLDQRRQQVYVEALIVEVSTGLAAEFGVQWNAGTQRRRRPDACSAAPTSAPRIGSQHPRRRDRTRATHRHRASTSASSTARSRSPAPTSQIAEPAGARARARGRLGRQRALDAERPHARQRGSEDRRRARTCRSSPAATRRRPGSATNPFQTIERKDIGITLRVTPQVSEAGAVKLKIFQEVSSVTRDKALVQSADIITNKRSLESTVLVDNGQIVVLGGLIQDDQQATHRQGPAAGRHPVARRALQVRDRATASAPTSWSSCAPWC